MPGPRLNFEAIVQSEVLSEQAKDITIGKDFPDRYEEWLTRWASPQWKMEKQKALKPPLAPKSSLPKIPEVEEEFAPEDVDALLEDLYRKGRTPEAETMLKGIGATDADIKEFFAPREPPKIPEAGLDFILPIQESGVEVRKLARLKPDFTVWLG